MLGLRVNNEFKNRYKLIDGSKERKLPANEHVENKYRSSIEQATEQVCVHLWTIGRDQLTLKQMVEKTNLKYRPNFIENYLNSAVKMVLSVCFILISHIIHDRNICWQKRGLHCLMNYLAKTFLLFIFV